MFDVPFPNPKILASFLATPEIRAILPANIRADGKRGRLDNAVARLLASYPVFIMLGAVVVLTLLTQYGLMQSLAAEESHALLRLTIKATQTDHFDGTAASVPQALKISREYIQHWRVASGSIRSRPGKLSVICGEQYMYHGKTLVVLFCMHRSGSSFATRLLQRLGMSLGPFDLLCANDSNVHGHFEAAPIVDSIAKFKLGRWDLTATSRDPAVLRRFLDGGGQWPAETAISEEHLRQGTELDQTARRFRKCFRLQGPAHRVDVAVLAKRAWPLSRTSARRRTGAALAARDRHEHVQAIARRLQLLRRPGRYRGTLPADEGNPRSLARRPRSVAVRSAGPRASGAARPRPADCPGTTRP